MKTFSVHKYLYLSKQLLIYMNQNVKIFLKCRYSESKISTYFNRLGQWIAHYITLCLGIFPKMFVIVINITYYYT